MCSQKNHIRSEDFRDTGDCMQELQPRRKARRVMDGGPYFKERNHRLVAGHVRKLIQEAVEDGVGELDLSNLELTDLPSEICDLNFAIVYNERGSFSLSNNRLKLFLSSNQFSTVPMDVFALHNLSVLSLRNNSIEVIPPEIGLLHNLVELSIGGNLLKVLPSQIALLPKLHILTVHPNPFMPTPDPDGNLGSVNHNDNQVGPPAFGAHNGNATVASMVSVQHNVTNQNEQAQQSMQTSLISPPVSPPTLQSEDVDMTPPPEQGGANNESLSLNILESEAMGSGAIIEETQLTRASSSQSSTLTPINIGGSRPHITTSLTTSEVNRGELPPHLTTRSRFPTLLILAGNALLNYMESQGITTTVKKGQTLDVERPRKDSKVSMSEDEWEESPQINNINHEQLWQMDKNQGAERNYSSLAVEPQPQKKRYIFREEIIKSHLTPYLFDHFKRAWANNLCAGCQRRFWKPCKIVVVWQDILGQSLVPIEWRGCGIRGCLGVPASMWLSRNPVLPSSELSSPVSNSMSVVASPSNSGSMVPVLVDETNLPPIT
ncbi:hypothetical protein BGX27_006158 [Mortierella sp. AM989]|nr:hypothetical protein BGX27_006158 [Mortierella sp. AM989]